MNQETPPSQDPERDPEPGAAKAPAAAQTTPPAADAALPTTPAADAAEPTTPGPTEPSGADVRSGPTGPSEPQPGGDRVDREAPRWEEPRPSGAETRWDEPRGGAGAGRRAAGEPRPRRPLEENLTSRSTWLRLVFIVLFAVAWWIAEFVLTAVIVIQFLWTLIDGKPNERLRALGHSLARYAYQVFRYMTFNSEQRPFPFDLDWPSGDRDEP